MYDYSWIRRNSRRSLIRGLLEIIILAIPIGILLTITWVMIKPGERPPDLLNPLFWEGLLQGKGWPILILALMACTFVVFALMLIWAFLIQIIGRFHRWRALRRFDPDSAKPDLIFVRSNGMSIAPGISADPKYTALMGRLLFLSPDSALAKELGGDMSVAMLGEWREIPEGQHMRIEGCFLDRHSRNSAIIAMDRSSRQCWMMGRIVPRMALRRMETHKSGNKPNPIWLRNRHWLASTPAIRASTLPYNLSWANGGWGYTNCKWGDGGTNGSTDVDWTGDANQGVGDISGAY